MKSGYSFFPLGDAAVLIEFGDKIEVTTNNMVLQLFYSLQAKAIPGIVDIVPAYNSLAVFYDVPTIGQHLQPEETVFDKVVCLIQKTINRMDTPSLPQGRQIRVPVCYSKKFGVDLSAIAIEKSISVEEVIHLHSCRQYRVYMIGFLPGFAYMGEVDDRITIPRRKEPRQHVEKGSVGIAGKQTGIYPVDAPGGWQIIGRTPLQIFDKAAKHPAVFRAGDEITFYPITEHEFENYKAGTV